MAHTIPYDETLGLKHTKINKLVQDAIMDMKSLDDSPLAETNQDIINLIKIDIASHNKDIDYILNVLKSEDLLYVSRAIKKGTWLMDDLYAHIINPEYLNNHLFPYMKTKASIKLKKHIRQYLKSENRVEQFYKNETNSKSAAKWLSRCSVSFIEANIAKHVQDITDKEFKRLCERSVTVFEAAIKDSSITTKQLKSASFLLHTHVNKYLDAFEKSHRHMRPAFGPCATEVIMKQSRERVMNNFFMYSDNIHIPTFVDYIKREEIKDFMFKLANVVEENHCREIFSFNAAKHFVKRMPKEEQFEFVKKVFLDKEHLETIDDNSIERGTEIFATKKICLMVCSSTPSYYWYEFAPFNIAFNDIKKLVQIEDYKNQINSMLKVLFKCAGANTEYLLSLITYYSTLNLNDPITQKKNFISNFFSSSEMYKYDEDTWNAFEQVLTEMNTNSDEYHPEYNEIITLYYVLQSKQVPETIENKLVFGSLQKYRKHLNPEEQDKVFDYLYRFIKNKIQRYYIHDEDDFDETVRLFHQLLDLFLDWDKEIVDYEFPLKKINELIETKIINSWDCDLSSFYNKKKSWRRFMFEESVLLNPSQKTFINALKHDPGLLERYKPIVHKISCDDTISLEQLLKKLRIYWPETLAAKWKDNYIDRMNKSSGSYKALARGLCTLLQHDLLLDIIKKYAPTQPKVDWNNIDEVTLSLQRNIAKNMHIARPQPSADAILMYAKGDFLQYALPSLYAIFYNMDSVRSQSEVPKLLNTPVSLQKHGVRFTFIKLEHTALKENLSNIWQSSKNTSIRAVAFELLFDLMSKEKDDNKIEELWDILEVFIDNLTFKEDKKIYKKLPQIRNVPQKLKPKFLIKSYKFLVKYLPHSKEDRASYEYAVKDLAAYTRNLMEFMCPVFVSDIITEYLEVDFFNSNTKGHDDTIVSIMSSYLLCAKDDETQMNKYEKILAPIIERALNKWNEKCNTDYFIRDRFQQLLTCLYRDLNDYAFKNKMIIPIKMFAQIQIHLEKSLDVRQNYSMLTMWKLVVILTDLIDKNNNRDDWHQVCSEIAPEFGSFCLEVLKQDVNLYFPCIYILFAKALSMGLREIESETARLQIYEVMLSDRDFIQAFLVTLKFFKGSMFFYIEDNDNNECIKKAKQLRNIIRDHPTVEVKMHYYNMFTDEGELLLEY